MTRGNGIGDRLSRLANKAGARRGDLRRLVELGALSEYRAALDFGRRHRVSPLVYPDAREAGLNMLPSWVDPRVGLVVDIGANVGAWSAHVLRVFPGLEIIAAEPGAEPLATLEARFAGHENVTVDCRAVTDVSGTSVYHRTRASVFASLLPPRAALHELYALPGSPTEVLEAVEVNTVTLDELVGQRTVSVLKLDVQGGELAVLNGGRHALERTAAVLVEVVFLPHYEGDATFAALDQALTRHGFRLMDLSPPFRLGDGPALWADACYGRTPSQGHSQSGPPAAHGPS